MIRELEFKLLCHRHSDAIYRYARSFLGNDADAEDATQEALFRLWQNIGEVPFLHARPWLFRTARNLCLDQIRRRSNRFSPVAVADDTLEAVPDDSAVDPVQQADAAFHTDRLNQALQQLPETLRSIFLLYEVHDLRYREIAETLDLPLNTVKVYLSRARTRLQQLLTEDSPWTKS
jgi:RNA polymerase sigma-70 factor (ECF subfamily)